VKRQLDEITGGGSDVEAILNVHPFHTVHVARMHELYPQARLYGTARHHARFPALPWQPERTEDPALHAAFATDFEFSVPRGVDFISADENVHCSSVLVLHRASRTIHVDDTLTYLRLPLPLRILGWQDLMIFHPTLKKALQQRPGAAQEFRDWAKDLAERWKDAQNLCAAHLDILQLGERPSASMQQRILAALGKVEKTLHAHQARFG
jgi:hypothetical protein